MDFTTEAIAEFILIWAQEFGEILTEARAREEATRLLELYLILLEPLPGEPGYREPDQEENQ
jgi:hypothetical protein